MPNWCVNRLWIEADMDKFLRDNMSEGIFSFENAVPLLYDRGSNREAFDMWGTMYGPDDVVVGGNFVRFITGWSPPLKWLETVALQYTGKIQMSYYELGRNFAGKIYYEDGNMVDHQRTIDITTDLIELVDGVVYTIRSAIWSNCMHFDDAHAMESVGVQLVGKISPAIMKAAPQIKATHKAFELINFELIMFTIGDAICEYALLVMQQIIRDTTVMQLRWKQKMAKREAQRRRLQLAVREFAQRPPDADDPLLKLGGYQYRELCAKWYTEI